LRSRVVQGTVAYRYSRNTGGGRRFPAWILT